MTEQERLHIRAIQAQIESLRGIGEDYMIVSVGARGANLDMPKGNILATVRMDGVEASAEAKHLDDAITLARAKIIRGREAREKARQKVKEATND